MTEVQLDLRHEAMAFTTGRCFSRPHNLQRPVEILLLVSFALALSLPAQREDADRKRFEDVKAQAEKGDASSQWTLGKFYFEGSVVAKDAAEAVKWFRKAAEQGDEFGQTLLASCYQDGDGVAKNAVEAVKWFRKAAEQGMALAEYFLGDCYYCGDGVAKDYAEAVKWCRKAAEQGNATAQIWLGSRYFTGEGVPKDMAETMKWFRKAAEQGDARAQIILGDCYYKGNGVPKDYVEAYKWGNLASAQGDPTAKQALAWLELQMTAEQIAEGQRLSREFTPRRTPGPEHFALPQDGIEDSGSSESGSGFFITEDGFLMTSEHVVKDAGQVRLVTGAGIVSARVVKVDPANDLALLKAEGRFVPLPVASSRTARLGSAVATVGFPNVGLQGTSPKLAKGEIASLAGARDDPRYFQISVPVQPGNSGGALVDERGNVVGVVSAKLDAAAGLATSGALPENVNYAVKSSFLLGFLESAPEVSAKLTEPNTQERKFEDVVKSAEQAAALVLVY